ncbi:sporulation protein [Comamonas testosteroni]|uniref:Sporulation protein n=1 Tax=Comamonas testosteroni TaxID=285 RepID=A0A373FFM5_COMTE|nr:SPOR domain-containing protein [Comamonas testosteroni]RGE42930.1 sporulation protein [Comamonas testosteroni]
MKNQQRGGTILGLIFGMVIGLAAALAVAIYVTKVPVPFLNKGGNNTERDAAEAERNRNWDPNAPLQSRQPAPPPAATPAPSDVTVATPTTPVQPTASGGVTTPEVPSSTPSTSTAGADKPSKPAPGDPLGDLVKERSAAADKAEKARAEKEKATQMAQAGDAAFNYFVQAGAFRGQSEAEAQRAKLAMLGWESRISEREQNGITVFRVRVGPFGKRDDAEQLKGRLDGAGVDSTLVRAAK